MTDVVYLALYFDAPLQSWGYASKFDRRTTLPFPTRSGVIGLLCAAAGIDRFDTDGLKLLDDGVNVSVFAFQFGGRLTDYHTVGGGYDSKCDPLKISRKAGDGKPGSTIQTWREYLEDSRFGVIVSGEHALIEKLAASVQDPVWGVWFGRKACVPAARIFEGVHRDEASALKALKDVAGGHEPVRTVRSATNFEDGGDTIMDRPLDFNPHARHFSPRRVRVE